jgi:hypothetical protein
LLSIGLINREAQGTTIADQTTWNYYQSNLFAGQSITTSGDSLDNLAFTLLGAGGPAFVAGDLILLSQEYLGDPTQLNSSTAGYLAQNTSVSGRALVFDSSVTLAASTQYFFYTTRKLQVAEWAGTPDKYAGGTAYFSTVVPSGTPSSFYRSNNEDLYFSLEGEVVDNVPDNGTTFALFGLALLGLFGVHRKMQSAAVA